ncbi:43kDa postsynaptic protein [Parasponia andersonii]|uniref:43kDa postsynaptic protein n=1 Tax=Parasponia andersonii TaxID=3476 RepID=A0A2P5D438_PARAD|nr:43kDa postsynaptic protein [Parasponia andersonii]
MGFPVGYTEVFFPNLFLHTLSLLGFIRNLIFSLFHLLGLSEFLETDVVWPTSSSSSSSTATQSSENPPVSAILIRELLPVIKFRDLETVAGAGEPPESCAVCLYEFEGAEEIRWLTNCKHVFHRACLDRWMDHDQKTCPLCRTPFVPDEMKDEFNQRLWAASGVSDFYSEYSSV